VRINFAEIIACACGGERWEFSGTAGASAWHDGCGQTPSQDMIIDKSFVLQQSLQGDCNRSDMPTAQAVSAATTGSVAFQQFM